MTVTYCKNHRIVGRCYLCEHQAAHRLNLRTLRAARAALAPELNRPIIGAVADKLIEELSNDQDSG
jgi:hypothetical protein